MAIIQKEYSERKYGIKSVRLRNFIKHYGGRDLSMTDSATGARTDFYLFCGATVQLKHNFQVFSDNKYVLEIYSGDKGLAKFIFDIINEKVFIKKPKHLISKR